MTDSEIKQAVEVIHKSPVNTTINQIHNELIIILDLATRYLSASEIVERKYVTAEEILRYQKCDGTPREWTDGMANGWNACHEAFTLAIMKKCEGLEKEIGLYAADKEFVKGLSLILTQYILSNIELKGGQERC